MLFSSFPSRRSSLRTHILSLLEFSAFAHGLTWPNQSYVTSPLNPPSFNITRQGKTEPGYLFLTSTPNIPGMGKDGTATIVDNEGELIWQSSSAGMASLRPQMLNGESVLTYWDGERPREGAWIGSIVILDHSYQELHRVTLGVEEGFTATPTQKHMHSFIDMHENVITDRGSVLVTAATRTRANLQAMRGPKNGSLLDYLVYEIDILTNDVLFRWKSSDHLSLSDSHSEGPVGFKEDSLWDYVHLNSVALYSDGFVTSSRMYCSVIAIGRNGTVLWRIDVRSILFPCWIQYFQNIYH